MIFDCEKCGDVDAVLIDGYNFAERTLEGIMFRVFYRDGKLVSQVEPDYADIFSDYNEDKWLKKCVEHVESMEDDVEGECPCCGLDIYLRPDDVPRGQTGPRPDSPSQSVGLHNLADIARIASDEAKRKGIIPE